MNPEVAVVPAPKSMARAAGQTARFYQPELDVLRFFAFFGVFLFHAFPRVTSFYDANQFPRWLSATLIPTFTAGAYGVDLFFALSAYLITGLLLRERDTTGALDLRSFYARRILRIWPLYLSFVAFAAMVSLLPQAEQLGIRLGWPYVAGYSLLAGNWVYVMQGLPAGFTIPLWTVSIEEQFYLTWPLAMRKASAKTMVWMALGVLAAANVMRVWLAASGASLEAMEYNTIARLDPIALGILLALASDRLPRWAWWQRVALVAAGSLSWVAAAAFNGCNDPQRPETWRLALTHPVIALGSAAILMAVIGAEHSFFKNSTLIYLGKISYGLYVVHEFGRFCASRLVHASTPLEVLAQSAVGLAFTIAIAAASYRWLESPFLRLKERFAHVKSRPV
ncbi:MAG TPA: acyltransferase [Candidatus Angelobacter sp.]